MTVSFTKRFSSGSVIRVDDLRLPLSTGVTILFGPSGVGKTTVLRCLAGLERPDEGMIQFDDEGWFNGARNLFVGPRLRRVGFVPQDYSLFPHLSVDRNIAYGLHELPRDEQMQRVDHVLDWLNIQDLRQHMPRELSGGQRQRVALARAIVFRPRLLLMDEPLSALDTPTRQRLRIELRRLLVESTIPTVLVTHDRQDALALGDGLVMMAGGRTLKQGTVDEVFRAYPETH